MDRVEQSLHRTVIWGTLAAAFRRPEDGAFALAAELGPAASALGIDAGALIEALGGQDESRRAGVRRRQAYDALFGHTARGPCPSHEAEYGEPKGHRYAHEIGDVAGFYRAFALEPARSHRERADHIATECEFLAFLALKEACAAQAHGEGQADVCRDASRAFLELHIGRFGRALASRVRRAARSRFYRAAADVLDAALLTDGRLLGATLGAEDVALREDAGTPDDACVSCGPATGTPR